MLRVLTLSNFSACRRVFSSGRQCFTPRCTGLYRPWLSISSCGTVDPRPPMRLSASWSATMSASISCSTLSTRCGSRRPSSPTALCMLYEATVMQFEPLTPTPTPGGPTRFLNVQVGDVQRIVLDELAAGFDDVAHQAGEDLV